MTKLTNDFHGTQTNVRETEDELRAMLDRQFEAATAKRLAAIRRRLCPSGKACTCSGPLGTR